MTEIGKDKVYIIAEMSANHAGKIENALQIVNEAAAAGADCVKIQTYTADTLTIPCDKPDFKISGGLWDGYTFYDLYKDAYTPWEWQAAIKEECEKAGVDFLSTPFDNTAVDFLEGLNVSSYKIASYELVDIPLIEYTASKHKPMIISCGMGSEEEIQDAVDACLRVGNKDIFLLKCCSEYPAKIEDMNLNLIPVMKERYGVSVGLSDHSAGYEAAMLAVAAGARVIEKHVMLDSALDNPDKGFSMTMTEFKEMVDMVRRCETIMGTGQFILPKKEEEGKVWRRSLYAVKDIKKGEIFTNENVRSIRPGYGMKPIKLPTLLGKNATMDIEYGTGLKDDMVEW